MFGGLVWLLFASGVIFGSQANVHRTTNNENDLLSAEEEEIRGNTVSDSDSTKWQHHAGKKELNLDNLNLDILEDSDYFDEPKPKVTSTSVYFPDNEQEVVEEPIVEAVQAPCLGCPAQRDPEDSKVKELALFAFAEYAKGLGGEDMAQQFLKVTKAQTQVVAGIKYILEVELGWMNCTKSQFEEGEDDNNCQLDKTKDTFTCDFHVVEKSWANTKEVTNAKCHKGEDPPPTIGTEASDYDKAMLDEMQIIADEEGTTQLPLEESRKRKKRETGSTMTTTTRFGSKKEAQESKEVIAELAKFAVDQLDQVDDDNNARLVVDVISAQKQTVSGWLYHLQIRVAQTTCPEGGENTIEKCKDSMILPFAICDVKILVQPWQTNQRKLTESQCRQEKYKKSKKIAKQLFRVSFEEQNRIVKEVAKKPLIGGNVAIDPDSPDLEELTRFAIDALDEASNAMHAQKLVRVVSAKRQLVSGIRTSLELEIGYTTCRKSPKLDKSKCEIDESRDHQYCTIIVVEKPWLPEKKLVDSKCGKRNGGPQDENTTPTPSPNNVKRKREVSSASIEDETYVDEDHEEFGNFIDKYGKTYESAEEYNYRLGIFKENMKKVKLLQQTEQGTGIYGATHFADLTEEEFAQRHLGLRPDLRRRIKRKQAKIPALAKIPDEFDWRHYNAVTPVKNQGSCGSCWAFSVSGNIEGAYAIKHGNLESFSEQELVDCDTLDEGCNGGLPENAYKVLEKLGGLETEKAYPYEGRDEKCHFKSELAMAKVSGFVEVSKNETEMAAWLVKNGPISIGINANAMQFYFGGVSHPFKFLCSPKSLDHGVLIVGFGVHKTSIRHKILPYWLVKNSWGPGWGEKGYYRVYRGDGTCGVNQMATSAIVM